MLAAAIESGCCAPKTGQNLFCFWRKQIFGRQGSRVKRQMKKSFSNGFARA